MVKIYLAHDQFISATTGALAALAVVLDELLEDADRARRLGRLAAERAEQFSLEAMVEGTLAVYAEALAQRAPFGEAAA